MEQMTNESSESRETPELESVRQQNGVLLEELAEARRLIAEMKEAERNKLKKPRSNERCRRHWTNRRR